MAENLFSEDWSQIDPFDLRALLDTRIGGPGQYSDADNVLHIPLAGDDCFVSLRFKGSKINNITPGKAFDRQRWKQIKAEIDGPLLSGPQKVGREITFSTMRVEGWWRGANSGIQILPPPKSAPISKLEIADHPFILEFPILDAGLFVVTNLRRRREHRRICRLLNLLLTATITFVPDRHQSLWAIDIESGDLTARWVTQNYFTDIGTLFSEELSQPEGPVLQVMPANEYYERAGHDGRGLRVPDDLDNYLIAYQKMSGGVREQFDRALYWLSLSSQQWKSSVSAAFASLVAAVEALTERGEKHTTYCDQCKKNKTHDAPGATENFREFFERYAPGTSQKKRRDQMYTLRSDIVHGSDLMQLDQDRAMGWDPPWWNERELHSELWKLMQTAMRNWLRDTSSSECQ